MFSDRDLHMKITAPAFAAFLALAGCGGQSPAENNADALEEAAEQSTPEAANVLMNAADEIRENNLSGAPGQPGSPTQQAMEAAGRAQVSGNAQPSQPVPPKGAKPHAKGDPVPPPKIAPAGETGQGGQNMQ
jgi:hypothetical protein